MIGVSENEFGAELFQRLLRKSLDAGRRTDGQEHRRLDPPVRRRKSSEPRPTRVRFPDLKRKVHAVSVAGRRTRSPPMPPLPAPKWPTAQIRSRNLRPA